MNHKPGILSVQFFRNGVGVLLIFGILLASCAALNVQEHSTPVARLAVSSPSPADDTEATLRMFFWQAPSMLNPHLTSASKDLEVGRLTYEPLASFDKQGNLVPFLAAEIPSRENGGVAADGKSVTWKLKQRVKWCDGEDFTADDVLFTYEFIMNPQVQSLWKSTYENIARIDVLDDYTVRLVFQNPTPAWHTPFVGPTGTILPQHVFAAYDGSNALDAPANTVSPIGTGPFCLTSFEDQGNVSAAGEMVEKKRILFEANPYFREPGKPAFKRVEIIGGGAVETAAEAVFRDGSVDYAWNLQLDAETLETLAASDTGRIVPLFDSWIERILLNRSDPRRGAESERSNIEYPHPFFSDKRVRQAFAHAIDREAIAALYGPFARPTTNNLVGPASFKSPNTANRYPFDLERSAILLDEAGWQDSDGDGIREKDGQKLHVTFQTTINEVRQQTQDIVRESLAQIGVDVELRYLDVSIMFGDDPFHPDYFVRFNADMQEYFDGNNSPDPAAYMQYWICKEIPRKATKWTGNNVERWCNPEYDQLYQQAQAELDPRKRQQLFIQMNDMLIEDVVMIPLVQRSNIAGINPSLVGINRTPWDTDTWNIKEWRR